MDEATWLACQDPMPMLAFLRRRASERKLRLFAVACCRRHRGAVRGKKNLRVLERAEEFAEGHISRKQMVQARREWYTFDYPFPIGGTWQSALAWATITHTKGWVAEMVREAAQASARPERERAVHAALLRDVFAPFHCVPLEPSCLTAGVRALAEATYAERSVPSGHLDPARLAVLADALEEFGCADEALLTHLRSPGPHVRGCFAVDLLLGKG
jgi:hypothetical protein